MSVVHLRPDGYRVFGPQDFGAPGLVARESVGPGTDVVAIGPIVAIHDSTFEPRSGIGHHPHRGMERLFYIVEGSVEHDDVYNGIQGHMGTGDLGILTEGVRGMMHSEWNHDDAPARCYILVYPTDPTPPRASFDAIRDADAPRVQSAEGVVTKQVITRERRPLHGDIREIGDTVLQPASSFEVALGADESGVVFVLEGAVDVAENGSVVELEETHTGLLPPDALARTMRITARERARVIHTVAGPGFGLRRRG